MAAAGPWSLGLIDAPEVFHEPFAPEYEPFCLAIASGCRQLNTYIDDFTKTLLLFDEATGRVAALRTLRPPQGRAEVDAYRARSAERDVFMYWRIIAARNAALVVFDFCSAIDAVQEAIRKIPDLDALLDKAELAKADAILAQYFSEYKAVRHGVAHAQEKGGIPKEAARHTVTDHDVAKQFNVIGGAGISQRRGTFKIGGDSGNEALVEFALDDDKFQTTWRGKMVGLAINYDTRTKLEEVKAAYFNVIGRLSEETFERRNSARQAKP